MNGSRGGAATASATSTSPGAGVAEFAVPDLGEGLTDAVVVRWLVEVGDPVEIDQPIVEMESAKALVEIPCPYAGIVEARHGGEGDVLPVGSPLVRVRERAAAVTDRPAGRTDQPAAPALVGFGPAAAGPSAARRPRPPKPVTHAAAGDQAAQAADGTPATPANAANAANAPRIISPVVRRLAQAAGLDLATVAATATGAGGVIRRADVERLLASPGHAESHPPASPEPPAAPAIRRIPLAARRVVAERMTRSRREIPEATAWRDVDFTDLLAAREAINADSRDRPVSVPGLLARICVAGLARHPELNATVDTERGEIVQYRSVNLGFAIAGARGLVVPVIPNSDAMTAPALSERLQELTSRAQAGSLTPAELTAGTFTINNHGALGTDGAVPIINHPEVAQLAVGRIAERPWVVDGEIRPRRVAQLTVAFDHRACDGAPVAGFITFLARCVEQPLLMISEL